MIAPNEQASIPAAGDTGDVSHAPFSSKEAQLPSAAAIWLKQNSLQIIELECVFHLDGAETALIAAQIPGNSYREKTLNCYILCGIRELLLSGNPSFTDEAARAMCDSVGCLDKNNHTTFLKGKGNGFTGSKEKGWVLTTPGKKSGAALISEINSLTP